MKKKIKSLKKKIGSMATALGMPGNAPEYILVSMKKDPTV
jgi:hypothetical protein